MTVAERLVQLFPLAKRTTLKEMAQTGRVRLGDAGGPPLRRLAEEIPEGKDVHVLARAPEPPRHRKGQLDIRFEDEEVLVVNKPPGLLTSTVPHEPRPTLLAKVSEYLDRTSPNVRLGLIHRLDKDARGLLVFSKNERAYESLKAQLHDRFMGREYHAVVRGILKPRSGTIESKLIEEIDGKVHSADPSNKAERRKGEPAITHFQTVQVQRATHDTPELSLLKLRLETGRKHQIRVHLSESGFPILGDIMYGRAPYATPPLLLAATKLTFQHPGTGKPVEFEIPVPDSFLKLVPRSAGSAGGKSEGSGPATPSADGE